VPIVKAGAVPGQLSLIVFLLAGFKQRNTLQTDLQILSELFIEDIARIGDGGDEREFLKECYCKSGALSQYAFISKEILQVRYSNLFQKLSGAPELTPATWEKGINPDC